MAELTDTHRDILRHELEEAERERERLDAAIAYLRRREFVLPESMIFSDEWGLYTGIGKGFRGHKRVNHKASIYVEGEAGTQHVESFFALFKNSVRGAHHNVSAKYLQTYVDEYVLRWNYRKAGAGIIFWEILDRARKASLAAS